MEVYFENIQSTIFKTICKSQQSINIAVAWFTDKQLFEKICDLAESGVLVELIIVDDEINKNAGLDYKKLLENGGSLILVNNSFANSLMHNKFCIIDKRTVINGSYNWTYKAQQNLENVTISENSEEFASKFLDEFNRIKNIYSNDNQNERVEKYISQKMKDIPDTNWDINELLRDKEEVEREIYNYDSIPRNELIKSVKFTIESINRKLKSLYQVQGKDTKKEDWSWALSLFESVITRCPSNSNINEQIDYLINDIEEPFGFLMSDYLTNEPCDDAKKFIDNQYSQLIPLFKNDKVVANSEDKKDAINLASLFVPNENEKRRQILNEHYNLLINLTAYPL